MHTIIKKIIKKQGQDVITSKILVNCIDDEGGFSDVEKRPYKKILKLIIEEGYSRKLLEIGAWNAEAETLARTFAQRNKLQEDEIIYVFSCLAYGLGWLKITPQIPAEIKKKRQQEAQKKAKEVEAAQKRNEEVIRKNAEEAARKKAEIAEKRALEAERQAAEAERKAKEAEKNAKERADKQAANLVISMIKNIGVIESTKECRDKVSAALLAYKMLNSSQQVLVDLHVGDALQRMADETKRIAAGVAQKKAENDMRLKIAAEERKKAEETAREREIARQKAAKEAQQKAEEEAQRKADELARLIAIGKKNRARQKSLKGLKMFIGISLIATWVILLIVNAAASYLLTSSWFNCIFAGVATFFAFYGIMNVENKVDDEHPIDTESPTAGTIAHIIWRIIWVLGLSAVCEIILVVLLGLFSIF